MYGLCDHMKLRPLFQGSNKKILVVAQVSVLYFCYAVSLCAFIETWVYAYVPI